MLAEGALLGLTGLESLELVLARAPDTPFVLVSGALGEGVAVAAIRAGARDSVAKASLDRLAPVVRRVLEADTLRRRNLEAERALQESDERFRRLAENVPDIIFRYRIHPTRVFEYVSPAIERILGYTPDEYVSGIDLVAETVDEADRERLVDWRAALARGEVPGEPLRMRFRHRDGRLVWTEAREVPVLDESGRVIAVEGIARDVTARHLAEQEQELLARQQELIAGFGRRALAARDLDDLLCDATELVADALTTEFVEFVELDPSGEQLLARAGVGWQGAWLGLPVAALDGDSPAARALRANADVIVVDLDSGAFDVPEVLQRHGVASGVAVVVPGEGGPLGALAAYSQRRRVFTGMDVHFLQAVAYTISEVAERLRSDRERAVSYELLLRTDRARRNLLASLVHAQEEERQRIATDIHDDSVQVLTALTLRLGLLRRRIDEPGLIEVVGEIEEAARLSISRLRRLIFELHPPALERNGLAPALRLYLEQARVDFGVDYELRSALTTEPVAEARATAYRIAQEALLNVCRHAGARNVEVDLSSRDDGVLVEIADDGVGFDAERVDETAPGHIGLASMRERAEMAGGWWSVDSSPGVGTTIRFFIPGRLDSAVPDDEPESALGAGAASKETHGSHPRVDR